MERKLASVQRVLDILPIEGADAIELAKINGWQCVVKKGEFKPGDLGVYFEIDSVLPDIPEFQFLWQPKNAAPGEVFPRPENFRIRTLKLRGALSQGLLWRLPPVAGIRPVIGGEVVEGTDLTDYYGVTKYDPPLGGKLTSSIDFRASFHSFIPKTDETRVQSVPRVIGEMAGLPYVITLKYDGTSSTYLIDPRDDSFHACGRNFSVREGDSVYWRVAREYKIEEALRLAKGMGMNIAIQGEIYGPGIQKNRLNVPKTCFAAFNVFDIDAARYMDHCEARLLLEQLEIPAVEVVEIGDSFAHTQESLLELAEGKYPGTQNEREGIVIRPLKESYSSACGGRLSFKAISNRFLLKGGD